MPLVHHILAQAKADLRRAKGPCPPPELDPDKFQERLSGDSRMQENLLAAAGGAYSASSDPLVGGEGAGCPQSCSQTFGFGPLGLAPDPK